MLSTNHGASACASKLVTSLRAQLYSRLAKRALLVEKRAIAAGNREPCAAVAPELAFPEEMEVPPFHSNVPQRPLETLDAETNNLGAEEGDGDALLRLCQEVTPQLLLDGSLESRARSLPALNVLASISNEGLNRAQTVAPD